jgi:uncharacterized protein (TIGR03067 family)
MKFRHVIAGTIFFSVVVSLGLPHVAGGDGGTGSFEFRAVAFGNEEQAATNKLNHLAAEGWEYVGPLGNGLVAFRRPATTKDLAARQDSERLQGTWTRIALTHGSSRRGVNADDVITFSGERFVQKFAGAVIQAGTFKIIDATSNPKQLDLLVTEGTNKGRHYRSIYKIEGDTLHLCSDDGTDKRPKEYSGKAGFYRVVRKNP